MQSVIDAQGGRTSGFDLMRLALAVCVLTFHTVSVCYGEEANFQAWKSDWRPIIYLMLPMFFALSGYLVAGSLERTTQIHRFIGLRAIRILPALAVETLLCAVILGALVTTLPLGEYFTNPGFFAYFLNILGIIHYELPGVFVGLPTDGIVNVSLWTVPYELECYLALVLLFVFGVAKHRYVMAALVLLACLVGPYLLEVPQYLVRPTGDMLVVSFLCGVCIYQFREMIPHHWSLMVVSLVIALVMFSTHGHNYWGAPFAAYVTVYFGLLKAPKLPAVMSGDYSYGLYLFAFPMQQLYVQLFPDARIWYLNALFAIVLGMAYAAFSWHVVEKPIMARRNSILGAVDTAAANVAAFIRRLLGFGVPQSAADGFAKAEAPLPAEEQKRQEHR